MNTSSVGARQIGAEREQYQAFAAAAQHSTSSAPLPSVQKPVMLRQVPRSTISETGYLLRLLVCLGALLALRLAAVYAAKTDLVLDEAQYWTWSRELAFGYFSKPPMIAWVIRGTSEICGNSEACVRSASPMLYTLAAIVIFFTGRGALRRQDRLLVGDHLRHAAGRLLFVAADHDRRSADRCAGRSCSTPG